MTLGNLLRSVEQHKGKLAFATNAGTFITGNSPKGLYVENGVVLVPIDASIIGNGNFYIQPNGVFIITTLKASIMTTTQCVTSKIKPLYATQSGPMLIINGKINTEFTKGSKNTYIRSGVGIAIDGTAVFAISEDAVNFYDFAAVFRDSLKCSN